MTVPNALYTAAATEKSAPAWVTRGGAAAIAAATVPVHQRYRWVYGVWLHPQPSVPSGGSSLLLLQVWLLWLELSTDVRELLHFPHACVRDMGAYGVGSFSRFL